MGETFRYFNIAKFRIEKVIIYFKLIIFFKVTTKITIIIIEITIRIRKNYRKANL